MRAALFRRHGGPEVLEVGEVPTPIPGAREVQIAVKAVALNHFDLWLRRGHPAMKVSFPHVSGGDVCGVVSAVGAGAQGVKEGDRVVVNPGLSCGRCRECLSGQDNLCTAYRMVGEQTWGGEAEYLVVPDVNIVPAPAGPSDAELASLPIVFMTAWHMLVDRAAIRPADTVLVLAAGSGVGVAAVQVAKLHGARVIAAASTAAKVARARDLGADEGINYAEHPDFVREVKRLTAGRGADIIVEHTGAATFPASVRSAAKGARIVTCGATDGFEAPLNLRHVFWRHLSILGSTLAPKGRLFAIVDLVAAGRLRAVVDRVLPLDQVAEGHRVLEAREAFGKVVLVP